MLHTILIMCGFSSPPSAFLYRMIHSCANYCSIVPNNSPPRSPPYFFAHMRIPIRERGDKGLPPPGARGTDGGGEKDGWVRGHFALHTRGEEKREGESSCSPLSSVTRWPKSRSSPPLLLLLGVRSKERTLWPPPPPSPQPRRDRPTDAA